MSDRPDELANPIDEAKSQIRAILMRLEKEQGFYIERVEIDCRNSLKFKTTIHVKPRSRR
jgi:hypothetical protein